MRISRKSLHVGAGAMIFASIIYLLVAAAGLLTDSASTASSTSAEVARQ